LSKAGNEAVGRCSGGVEIYNRYVHVRRVASKVRYKILGQVLGSGGGAGTGTRQGGYVRRYRIFASRIQPGEGKLSRLVLVDIRISLDAQW
jgi:hypothetical protein